MDIQLLKEYIYENNYIEQILQSIGCHHVKYHPQGNPDPYWSAANKDGDNTTAINVYNKSSLRCVNYTRDMTNGKDIPTDIISLVCFTIGQSLFEGIKFICEIVGIDYYHNFEDDIPESLKITKLLYQMQSNIDDIDEDRPIKPISERILTYYKPYVNDMFLNDGISYETQKEFGIGYDESTNRITIPIYSEINDLIGVKGRLFKTELEENELKYVYLEPCARNKILYGINKTYPFIKQQGSCIIGESEKSCMQLWSMGYQNCIGIGGSKVSSQQIEKLSRLGIDLIFAFDKDIPKQDIESIANRFVEGIPIYAIYDDKNILSEKASPMDRKDHWEFLYKNCLYRIK
jgi:DNA primase